jgi:hypothetical protein
MRRVTVHYNLTRGDWVICAYKSKASRGKVIAYADAVTLTDCRMQVCESTRDRIVEALPEKKRSVHAWVEGTWSGETSGHAPAIPGHARRFTYNPYRAPYFHVAGDVTERVESASVAYFTAEGGAWYE